MKLVLKKPVAPYFVNQPFGANATSFYKELGMKGHNGLDLKAEDGQAVFAAHDGLITFTGEDSSAGLGVVIRTERPFSYKDGEAYFKSIYWHLKPNTFLVKPGDRVKAGEKIAEADNTGKSTGSHLHFGIKPIKQGEEDWHWQNIEQDNGYFGMIDPSPYFERSFNYNWTKQMKLGDGKGTPDPDVFALQMALATENIFTRQPTGYYGDITASAVIDFQIKYDVASLTELFLPWLRGKRCGPKTLAKLNELYGI